MSSVDDQQQWEFWGGQWWWRKNDDSKWEWASGDTWWMDNWGQWQRREEITPSDRGTSGGTGPAGVSTVDPNGDGAGNLGGAQRDGAQCWRRPSSPAGAGTGPSGVSTGGSYDAMKEIEDLRTFQVWAEFVGKVREAITGAPRHALAQHITTSNQP